MVADVVADEVSVLFSRAFTVFAADKTYFSFHNKESSNAGITIHSASINVQMGCRQTSEGIHGQEDP
jgi:hypothetical protein